VGFNLFLFFLCCYYFYFWLLQWAGSWSSRCPFRAVSLLVIWCLWAAGILVVIVSLRGRAFCCTGEIRSLRVLNIAIYTMEEFRAWFELAPTSSVHWFDEEEDKITVRTDTDLREFLVVAARTGKDRSHTIYVDHSEIERTDAAVGVSAGDGGVTSKDEEQPGRSGATCSGDHSFTWCTNPPQTTQLKSCGPWCAPSAGGSSASPSCADKPECQKPAPETTAGPPFPAEAFLSSIYWFFILFGLYLVLPSFLFRAFVAYRLLSAVFGDSTSARHKICDLWTRARSCARDAWNGLVYWYREGYRKDTADRLTAPLRADHPLRLLVNPSTTAADLRELLSPAPAAAPSSC